MASKRDERRARKAARRAERQSRRSDRRDSRSTKRSDRRSAKLQSQESRREARSQRQSQRQEARGGRIDARKQVGMARIQAKQDSGYWSPEAVAARQSTLSNIVDTGGGLLGGLLGGGAEQEEVFDYISEGFAPNDGFDLPDVSQDPFDEYGNDAMTTTYIDEDDAPNYVLYALGAAAVGLTGWYAYRRWM